MKKCLLNPLGNAKVVHVAESDANNNQHQYNMTTYQIHYNKSIFNAIDIEEAEQIAKSLIEPSMPFKARIIAVDENEDFIQTIE